MRIRLQRAQKQRDVPSGVFEFIAILRGVEPLLGLEEFLEPLLASDPFVGFVGRLEELHEGVKTLERGG